MKKRIDFKGNRNYSKITAYFELGGKELTLSVDATQQDVDKFIKEVNQHLETERCVEVKLNDALEILLKKYPELEEKVLAHACALNAATC